MSGSVEVKLNDVLVQQNVEVTHETQAGLAEICNPRGVLPTSDQRLRPSLEYDWVLVVQHVPATL